MGSKLKAFPESRWQLEQHVQRWRVLHELEQSAVEFQRQHRLPLRSAAVSEIIMSFLTRINTEHSIKGVYFPPEKEKNGLMRRRKRHTHLYLETGGTSIAIMKVIDNIFDTICDFDELYDAHMNARKGKRFRPDVLEFTDRLEENLIEIQNELMYETYKVGKYRKFYVKEPKLRLVMALQYRDRVVQWAIYKQLNPFYDKLFIEDSYACRIGKGSHRAADRLQYWLKQVSRKPEKWYYLKLDISKYFYRVDHEVLLSILERRVKDQRLMRLLHKIVNCEDTKFGLPAGFSPEDCTEDMWLSSVGMPIGNLTSQLFANIYLNELDQYCKHELNVHYYIRYMDDIIILSSDKPLLHRLKTEIEIFLKDNLRLDLNNKTAIRPVELGIDFVGYKIWSTHRKLKKKTARRIMIAVKKKCQLVKCSCMTIEEFYRATASFCGVLMHCDSFGLRRKLNSIYDKYAYADCGDDISAINYDKSTMEGGDADVHYSGQDR